MNKVLVCLLGLHCATSLYGMEKNLHVHSNRPEVVKDLSGAIRKTLILKSVMSICSHQQFLYVGLANGELKEWDLNEQRWVRGTNLSTCPAKMLSYTHRDGTKHIIIGCGNGSIVDHNLTANRNTILVEHEAGVTDMCFEFESDYEICSVAADGSVAFIDLKTAQYTTFAKKLPCIRAVSAIPNNKAGNRRIVFGCEDGSVIIYNLETTYQKKVVVEANQPVMRLNFSRIQPQLIRASLAVGNEWFIEFKGQCVKKSMLDETMLLTLESSLKDKENYLHALRVTEKEILKIGSGTPVQEPIKIDNAQGYIITGCFCGSNPYLVALGSTNSKIYLIDLMNPQSFLTILQPAEQQLLIENKLPEAIVPQGSTV